MNPYSQIDSNTLGYLGQAGIDPSMAPAPQQPQQQKQGAYPTYPNAAGVGSQTAGVFEQKMPPTTSPSDPKNAEESSRGMSPYALLGDANYRDR